MKKIIEQYRNIVVQIATPTSIGTGFYLKDYLLIVTNEHVVQGNKEVIVEGTAISRQMANVVFTDPKYDLAFVAAPLVMEIPAVNIAESRVQEGDSVIAIGQPFGLTFTVTQGIVSNAHRMLQDVSYIQIDAAINPGNSGGPLINTQGEIVGVNSKGIEQGDNIGFALTADHLSNALRDFKVGNGNIGTRCFACSNPIFIHTIEKGGYCPHCGAKSKMPSEVEEYTPTGTQRTIENLISKTGHDIRLSRRGPGNWELIQGSSQIQIAYNERSSLIVCDAVLCSLPKENIKQIYEFLLRQNYHLEGLTLSIRGQNIMLSLLIYDRYFNADTGQKLLSKLLEKADYFDDVLINQFGAQRKQL